MTDVGSETAETLVQRVRGMHAGTITVLDAGYSFDVDVNGELAVFLDLQLSEPEPPGAETWPIEDVLTLHRLVDDEARALLRGQAWHVRLAWPGEPEPDDDDDEDLE